MADTSAELADRESTPTYCLSAGFTVTGPNPYSTISPTDVDGPVGFLCALQPKPAFSLAGSSADLYPPSVYSTIVPSGSAASAASVSTPKAHILSFSVAAA